MVLAIDGDIISIETNVCFAAALLSEVVLMID